MKQNGFVALTTVLIVLGVVLALSATVSYLSIGEAQSAFALNQGEATLQFVEGCMEDALLKSKQSAAYTGGTISRPEGTCQITVSKVGSTWTITSTNTLTTYKRTVQTVINRNSSDLVILSWKEI